jgi:dTDP-4-amino-4,6-dideoxygalactose transaminase
MRIGRTLPPAASPLYICDLLNGFKGLIRGQREIERFRAELREYFDAKYCFLVSTGRAALTLILQALHDNYPDRDEVLIPAFACYSVPSAIVRAGLKVSVCDVNAETFDFDYDQLKKILSPSADRQSQKSNNANPPDCSRLLAIVPVHLFGLPADIENLKILNKDSKHLIVEDAAQALGATWNGVKLGTLGDVSFFSLGRGKSFSTVDGGIILTNNDDIAKSIRKKLSSVKKYKKLELINLLLSAIYLTIFQYPALFWFPKLLPFLRVGDTFYDPYFKIRKMSGFQAGLAKNWRTKLKNFKKNRQENSRKLISTNNLNYFQYLNPQNDVLPDLIRLPIRIDDRNLWNNLLRGSNSRGLGIMFTYPDSINAIPELKSVLKDTSCPVAAKLPHQIVTLPIHSFVAQKDIKKIKALISQIFK